MGVIGKDTKFPVVDPAPSFTHGVRNFNFRDYATIAAFTGISIPFGYITGKPLRRQTMIVAGGIGLLGGFMFALQNSFGRLMGVEKNDAEVARMIRK